MILPGVLSASKLGMGADVFQSEAPDFSGFALTVNPDFNPTRGQRKLKDGTPFTSVMDDVYDGITNYWMGGLGQESGPIGEVRLESILKNGASYRVGRNGFRQMIPLYILFRVTGDVALLDEMTRLGIIAYNHMWHQGSAGAGANGWPTGTSATWDYHGERTWVSDLSGFGHDNHLSDTPRSFRTFVNLARALQLNRNVTSPAGYDYGEWADKWKAVFEGYERVWTTVGDGYYPSGAKVETTYKGFYVPGDGFTRATGLPPNRRGTTHTNLSCSALSYLMGQVLGKEQAGFDGYEDIMRTFFEDEVYYVDPGENEKLVFMRGFHTWTSTEAYLIPIVYAEYVFMDIIDMYLEGNPGGFIDLDRFMRGAVRSYRDFVLTGTPTSMSAKPDLGGGVDRTATRADGGEVITIIDACEGRNGNEFCTPRDKNSFGLMGQSILQAWDDEGTFSEFCYETWKTYSNDGTVAQPENITYPVGLFLKESGIFA